MWPRPISRGKGRQQRGSSWKSGPPLQCGRGWLAAEEVGHRLTPRAIAIAAASMWPRPISLRKQLHEATSAGHAGPLCGFNVAAADQREEVRKFLRRKPALHGSRRLQCGRGRSARGSLDGS